MAQQQTKIKIADGQRVWHFPKQDTQMASTYIKDAQHDWLPKNCKWKLQWDITSDLLNGCYQKKWQDQARKKTPHRHRQIMVIVRKKGGWREKTEEGKGGITGDGRRLDFGW